jgi:hypothetical protein
MSRDLPDRPHLEHLKKQAKALLHSLRESQQDATLSDAQHAVARQYGFPSWPKLKAYVDGLPPQQPGTGAGAGASGGSTGGNAGNGGASDGESPRPLFDRLTTAMKEALFFSRFEATEMGRLGIAPEHVLLGIIRRGAGVNRRLLERAGVTLENARGAVAAVNPPKDEINEPVQVPFDDRTKALFRLAADEADRLGHERIGMPHLLLALMQQPGTADLFLRGHQLTPDAVREAARSAAPDDLQ